MFRSAGFTWGTVLSTLVSFAMFGIFFAMPQYFQEVRGVNAMGSGLRLLPMIGGMVIGMIGGTRLASPRKAADGMVLAPLASAKALVTAGFAIMAVTLGFGATTTVDQRHRVHGRVVRRLRARPRAGDAADDERGAISPCPPSAAARARP